MEKANISERSVMTLKEKIFFIFAIAAKVYKMKRFLYSDIAYGFYELSEKHFEIFREVNFFVKFSGCTPYNADFKRALSDLLKSNLIYVSGQECQYININADAADDIESGIIKFYNEKILAVLIKLSGEFVDFINTKICSHKKVALILRENNDPCGRILLTKNLEYPFGFASLSGHVYKFESPFEAGVRIIKEIEGFELVGRGLEMIMEEMYYYDFCRRIDGLQYGHKITIYSVEHKHGLLPKLEEGKYLQWFSLDEVMELLKKTKAYLNGGVAEYKWKEDPGLEVLWCGLFK